VNNFLETLSGIFLGLVILCTAIMWYGHVSNEQAESAKTTPQEVLSDQHQDRGEQDQKQKSSEAVIHE
jgi:cytoskeletal protein RodZ